MDYILTQLKDLRNELNNSFPYKDMDNIQQDFRREFSYLSDDEDSLTGDFNTYCMNIAGTLSYVLANKTDKIPESQIKFLQKSFFELFPQYQFFENKIQSYKDFAGEYKSFEKTRTLLVKWLFK
jgi:hypothetical protein